MEFNITDRTLVPGNGAVGDLKTPTAGFLSQAVI